MRYLIFILILLLALAHGEQSATGQTIPYNPGFDVASIIDIHSANDAQALRQRLIDLLWCGALPSGKAIIEPTREWNGYAQRIDRIVVNMDFGLQSIGRLFVPHQRNGRLVIYHNGHSQGIEAGMGTVNLLLESGFDVAAFTMPMMGENKPVWIDDPYLGRIYIYEHQPMSWLKPACGHPLRYFLEPVIVYLNGATDYSDISMIGISGGGWTTTLAAALDTRIKYSFPVAGSMPEYLRQGRNWGDWEQHAPEVYRIANYLELYVLATDQGRQQLQILNKWDPCCFAGAAGAESYRSVVSERASLVGGQWNLWIDPTHIEHIVSSGAVAKMMIALNTESSTINEQSFLPFVRK